MSTGWTLYEQQNILGPRLLGLSHFFFPFLAYRKEQTLNISVDVAQQCIKVRARPVRSALGAFVCRKLISFSAGLHRADRGAGPRRFGARHAQPARASDG